MAFPRVRTYHLLVALVIVESLYLLSLLSKNQGTVSQYKQTGGGSLLSANEPERNLSRVIYKFMDDIKDEHPSMGAGGIPPIHDQIKPMEDDMHYYQEKEPDKPFTLELLKDYLQVPVESRKTLREQHKRVVSRLPKLEPETISGRGIVMVGGGRVFANTLVAIHFYLKNQPGIPIELWLSRSEYEPKYCKDIFPGLGVRCMVFEDQLGPEIERFNFIGYPSKSLALMGSRFEEIYFTDIDSFPIFSIHDFFESEVFEKYGFISWPDYWLRVTTPEFYDVAGVFDIDIVNPNLELLKIPGTVSDKLASEAGQMVFNKTKHWDTMFLSAYYNLNGNDYYYRLLSQHPNVDGFGDKETWMAAATVLGHPGYQVVEYLIMMGYDRPDGTGYEPTAMIQRDPMLDYRRNALSEEIDSSHVRAYIIHANGMKFDPYYLFGDNDENLYHVPNVYASPRRLLGNLDQVKRFFTEDMELMIFQSVESSICELVAKHPPLNAPEDLDLKQVCQRAKAHVAWLKEHDENTPPPPS